MSTLNLIISTDWSNPLLAVCLPWIRLCNSTKALMSDMFVFLLLWRVDTRHQPPARPQTKVTEIYDISDQFFDHPISCKYYCFYPGVCSYYIPWLWLWSFRAWVSMGAKGAWHLYNFWTALSGTRRFWQFYYIMLCFTLKIWGFTSVWHPLLQIPNSSPEFSTKTIKDQYTQTMVAWSVWRQSAKCAATIAHILSSRFLPILERTFWVLLG